MLDYYDRQGKPIDMWEWARKFEDPDYKIVQQDRFDNFLVSTVWLGLDHNYSSKGRPLIFETMIFEGDTWIESQVWRYSTEKQAIVGHKRAVNVAKRICQERAATQSTGLHQERMEGEVEEAGGREEREDGEAG